MLIEEYASQAPFISTVVHHSVTIWWLIGIMKMTVFRMLMLHFGGSYGLCLQYWRVSQARSNRNPVATCFWFLCKCCVFGFCLSPIIPKATEHNVSETVSVSFLRWKEHLYPFWSLRNNHQSLQIGVSPLIWGLKQIYFLKHSVL
jgi:hypothetical protein